MIKYSLVDLHETSDQKSNKMYLTDIGVAFELHLRDWIAFRVVGIIRSGDGVRNFTFCAVFCRTEFTSENVTEKNRNHSCCVDFLKIDTT